MIQEALEAPPGTVQCGPDDSELISGLAQRLMNVLRLRGYRQVMVPVYEPFDLYASLYGPEVRSRLVTFTTDREYALRPDLTAGICRTLAPSMTEPPASPIRLAAWGRAYRHERVRRLRQREFHQLGIERLGDSTEGADLEVLSLARAILLDAGLTGGMLRVGHGALRRSLLGKFPASVHHCLDALSRLRDRLHPPRTGADVPKQGGRTHPEDHEDFPSFLSELARDTGLDVPPGTQAIEWLEDTLRGMFQTAGLDSDQSECLLNSTWSSASLDELADSLAPVWPTAREEIHAALDHVESCADDLDPLVLRFSLGAGRWSDFYTGFTFEIDVPVLGPDVSQVLGGGRYDNVMPRLGAEGSGACGFALGLERLAAALTAVQGTSDVQRRFVGATPILVAWTEETDMEASAAVAETLGGMGCSIAHHTRPIAMHEDGPDHSQLTALAALPGTPYRHAVIVSAGEIWAADLAFDTCFEVDHTALRLMFDRRKA